MAWNSPENQVGGVPPNKPDYGLEQAVSPKLWCGLTGPQLWQCPSNIWNVLIGEDGTPQPDASTIQILGENRFGRRWGPDQHFHSASLDRSAWKEGTPMMLQHTE